MIFKHRALVRTKNQVFGGDFPRRWVVGYCTLGGPYGAKFSRGTNNPGSEKSSLTTTTEPAIEKSMPYSPLESTFGDNDVDTHTH